MGGRPLWDNLAYFRQHRRDITQTFMVDRPSGNTQTHKVLGRNSPSGRVGGPKSRENPGNPEKLSPGQGGGYWGGRPLGLTEPRRVCEAGAHPEGVCEAVRHTHEGCAKREPTQRGCARQWSTPAKGVRNGTPQRGCARPWNHRTTEP